MDAQTRISTIRDYAAQVLNATGELNRALTELNKHLGQLPVAETINAAEVEARENAVAERERDLREKFKRVDALMKGDG